MSRNGIFVLGVMLGLALHIKEGKLVWNMARFNIH